MIVVTSCLAADHVGHRAPTAAHGRSAADERRRGRRSTSQSDSAITGGSAHSASGWVRRPRSPSSGCNEMELCAATGEAWGLW